MRIIPPATDTISAEVPAYLLSYAYASKNSDLNPIFVLSDTTSTGQYQILKPKYDDRYVVPVSSEYPPSF